MGLLFYRIVTLPARLMPQLTLTHFVLPWSLLRIVSSVTAALGPLRWSRHSLLGVIYLEVSPLRFEG